MIMNEQSLVYGSLKKVIEVYYLKLGNTKLCEEKDEDRCYQSISIGWKGYFDAQHIPPCYSD